MEKSFEEILVQFYVDQYRENAKRSTGKPVKLAHYIHRLNSKAKSIKYARFSKNETVALDKLHQEIKRLALITYYSNNKNARQILNREILPQLVRVDMEQFDENEAEYLTEDFLKLLRKEYIGAICTRSMKALYNEYRSKELRREIVTLVPARPELEFPKAQSMKRHFILHIGPTNSGKTYQALERLKLAQNGVYLGPLRLLALEVYEKMNDAGIPCTMLTGQECLEVSDSRITASTVEMLDCDKEYDIAVIDEAQMVADDDRGHSWTRAILGTLAGEIHICMSPVAKDVVVHLINLCHDEYEIREYERKTALKLEDKPFSFPQDVREGDAFIVFSKKSVLNIAGRLEENGIKPSVIYGSLPPEIRRRQMTLFNEKKTQVVVSTDAIGMGLNLPVRRIVFLEVEKFDGVSRRPLVISEIKQIAGRAGRFGLYDTGYVTALGQKNLNYLKNTLNIPEQDIDIVSLGFPQVLLTMDAPLDAIIKLWHEAKPSAPFRKINVDEILFLYGYAYKERYFIADFDDKYLLYKMITCPIDIKDRELVRQWLRYCMSYTSDISLDKPDKHSKYQGLMKYESYYKKLDLYYQFSVRMGKIVEEDWLENERDKTQAKIMQLLSKSKDEYIIRCRYCGRILPIGNSRNICRDCYSMIRR